jgi:hypothetical protein
MTIDRAAVVSALRAEDVVQQKPPRKKRYWVKCTDPSHTRKTRPVRGGVGTYCQTCQNTNTRSRRSRTTGPLPLRKLYGYLTCLANTSRGIRRISCSLTFDEFCMIRRGPCRYCGGALPPKGVGLDRIDAKRGYDADNVVPACARCNHARGAFITFDEFSLIMRMRRERLGPDADLWSEHEDRGGLVRSRRAP